MRSNGYEISEKLFDRYLQSGAKTLDDFLYKNEQTAEKVASEINKVREKISKNETTEKSVEKTNTIADRLTPNQIKKLKIQYVDEEYKIQQSKGIREGVFFCRRWLEKAVDFCLNME